MIEVSQVSKRFGAVTAIDRVDLTIARGEKTVIAGANGSGKSTLLKLMVGLLRPSRGSTTIEGSPPSSSKTLFGYLGHDNYLYPYLTIEENLSLFSRMYGVASSHSLTILDALGLGEKIKTQVSALSRGEAQKAGIARCMVHSPQLLFLDEPMTGLDDASARTLENLLEDPAITVVMASHITPRDPDRWRMLTLRNGRVLR